MGRKHRLKYQKRYYLPRTLSLTVSIPLEKLNKEMPIESAEDPSSSLIVSIPLTQYKKAPVNSLANLLQRVHASGFTFPPGWIPISSATTEFIICWMDVSGKEPIAVVTFRAIDDLSWTISVLGREVVIPEAFSCLTRVHSIYLAHFDDFYGVHSRPYHSCGISKCVGTACNGVYSTTYGKRLYCYWSHTHPNQDVTC